MKLTKYRIGDYFESYSQKCNIPNLTASEVSGINIEKEFFEPSRQVGEDTSKYKIVPPNYFACNLMHVGRDVVLPIALNHTDKNKIVSPAYTVFKIKDGSPILRDYFFILLKSHERDRFFWFNTDSSIRGDLPWEVFCNIELNIPHKSIQEKYVAVYKAMIANQRSYERGLEDLRIVFEGYLDNLRRTESLKVIKPYITLVETKNDKLEYGLESVRGVSIDKKFIETKADMTNVNLKPYYVVKPNEFAYVTVTSRNGEKISLALNDSTDSIICSSSYVVFRSIDENKLLPQYLMLYFSRSEFNRYARFNSWGSAREAFSFEDMCDVKIPIPDISVQKAIANIFTAYNTRKRINEQLKAQIKDLCPILIRGSIKEGENG